MVAGAYLIVAVAAMLIIFFLTNKAVLAVRNPLRTGWLAPGKGAENWLALPCISAMIMVIPFVGAGVFGLIPGVLPGGLLFVGLVALCYIGMDRQMKMSTRLALCDDGKSPFKG